MSKHSHPPSSNPTALSAVFDAALAAHQAGQLQHAAEGYRQVLAQAPMHADALHLLGVAHYQSGEYALAETLIQQSLEQAENPFPLSNLAITFKAQDKQAEAEAAYRRALAIKPDYTDAHYNLGLLLHAQQRLAEAEACYRQALALQPQHLGAQNNLGSLHQEQNRYAEAEHAFRQALAINPQYAEGLNNLGGLLQRQQRWAEAEHCYLQAASLKPDYTEAHYNLGGLLQSQGRLAEAEAVLLQVLARQPNYADAYNALGNIFIGQTRFIDAETAFQAARQLDPGYRHLVGLIGYAQRQLCNWSQLAADEAQIVELVTLNQPLDIPPFSQLASALDAPAQLQLARCYADSAYPTALAASPLVDPASHPQRTRLRIGYLSADFHEHATMHLLIGALERHDSACFEVYLYSYGPDTGDEMRRRVQNGRAQFRDLAPLPDRAAAEVIAADGIDILVDLKGYTQHNRLGISALRPAPLLVSWLGYPGTLGHPRLADYLIGDSVVSPLEHAAHFSETLALLPHCYQPNDAERRIGTLRSRQQAGLPEHGFVFCSFNQSYKINPEMFARWCRLLLAVPDSVLWLLEPKPAAIDNLRRAAVAHGVDPQRLIFAPLLAPAEHLGRLQLADLALDTFPVTSHTTASDALWVGVPLVTRLGETFVSRVAASLLHAVGLPELVTDTEQAYFELARDLALNPTRLAALRSQLAEQRSNAPLFDSAGFTRNLEALYRRMWQQHADGKQEAIVLS